MIEKSLVIITPGFPKDENDSTCLPSQQLFTRTVKEIFPTLNIVVVALHYPAQAKTYTWNGITIHALHGKQYRGIARTLLWLKAYRIITAIAKEKNVAGVISFWCNETALIGKFAHKKNSIPHKIWICGQDARKSNVFVKWIRPSADDLVAMSDFLQNEFHRNHNIKPGHVVPNAVRPTFQNVTKDIDIIGAGSLIELKQFTTFVEVIAEVKKTIPSITAVLFGKGPEEKKIKTLIAKLGLTGTITLYSEVDHDTLMNWMNRSKVLLHPSSYEGYSTVCLEALANGCHVVSYAEAENAPVPHWKIVHDKNEMVAAVTDILENVKTFSPIFHCDMATSVRSMISLFPAIE